MSQHLESAVRQIGSERRARRTEPEATAYLTGALDGAGRWTCAPMMPASPDIGIVRARDRRTNSIRAHLKREQRDFACRLAAVRPELR